MNKATSYLTLDRYTRVRQLLGNITTRDTGLVVVMDSIRANTILRNDFEDTGDVLCQAERSSRRTKSSTKRIYSFNQNKNSKGKSQI